MNCLVIFCHPKQDSYSQALCLQAQTALEAANHDVKIIDLYRLQFDPVLSAEEWDDYEDPSLNTKTVEEHVVLLQWAEMLVFVYPTWWYGLPALLKGWLDRLLVPDVAFTIPTETDPIQPKLLRIKKIAVITTCGASWWLSKYIGEPGRKTILRGIRILCHSKCKTLYMALYKMDTVSAEKRIAYLADVERKLRRF